MQQQRSTAMGMIFRNSLTKSGYLTIEVMGAFCGAVLRGQADKAMGWAAHLIRDGHWRHVLTRLHYIAVTYCMPAYPSAGVDLFAGFKMIEKLLAGKGNTDHEHPAFLACHAQWDATKKLIAEMKAKKEDVSDIKAPPSRSSGLPAHLAHTHDEVSRRLLEMVVKVTLAVPKCSAYTRSASNAYWRDAKLEIPAALVNAKADLDGSEKKLSTGKKKADAAAASENVFARAFSSLMGSVFKWSTHDLKYCVEHVEVDVDGHPVPCQLCLDEAAEKKEELKTAPHCTDYVYWVDEHETQRREFLCANHAGACFTEHEGCETLVKAKASFLAAGVERLKQAVDGHQTRYIATTADEIALLQWAHCASAAVSLPGHGNSIFDSIVAVMQKAADGLPVVKKTDDELDAKKADVRSVKMHLTHMFKLLSLQTKPKKKTTTPSAAPETVCGNDYFVSARRMAIFAGVRMLLHPEEFESLYFDAETSDAEDKSGIVGFAAMVAAGCKVLQKTEDPLDMRTEPMSVDGRAERTAAHDEKKAGSKSLTAATEKKLSKRSDFKLSHGGGPLNEKESTNLSDFYTKLGQQEGCEYNDDAVDLSPSERQAALDWVNATLVPFLDSLGGAAFKGIGTVLLVPTKKEPQAKKKGGSSSKRRKVHEEEEDGEDAEEEGGEEEEEEGKGEKKSRSRSRKSKKAPPAAAAKKSASKERKKAAELKHGDGPDLSEEDYTGGLEIKLEGGGSLLMANIPFIYYGQRHLLRELVRYWADVAMRVGNAPEGSVKERQEQMNAAQLALDTAERSGKAAAISKAQAAVQSLQKLQYTVAGILCNNFDEATALRILRSAGTKTEIEERALAERVAFPVKEEKKEKKKEKKEEKKEKKEEKKTAEEKKAIKSARDKKNREKRKAAEAEAKKAKEKEKEEAPMQDEADDKPRSRKRKQVKVEEEEEEEEVEEGGEEGEEDEEKKKEKEKEKDDETDSEVDEDEDEEKTEKKTKEEEEPVASTEAAPPKTEEVRAAPVPTPTPAPAPVPSSSVPAPLPKREKTAEEKKRAAKAARAESRASDADSSSSSSDEDEAADVKQQPSPVAAAADVLMIDATAPPPPSKSIHVAAAKGAAAATLPPPPPPAAAAEPAPVPATAEPNGKQEAKAAAVAIPDRCDAAFLKFAASIGCKVGPMNPSARERLAEIEFPPRVPLAYGQGTSSLKYCTDAVTGTVYQVGWNAGAVEDMQDLQRVAERVAVFTLLDKHLIPLHSICYSEEVSVDNSRDVFYFVNKKPLPAEDSAWMRVKEGEQTYTKASGVIEEAKLTRLFVAQLCVRALLGMPKTGLDHVFVCQPGNRLVVTGMSGVRPLQEYNLDAVRDFVRTAGPDVDKAAAADALAPTLAILLFGPGYTMAIGEQNGDLLINDVQAWLTDKDCFVPAYAAAKAACGTRARVPVAQALDELVAKFK